MSAANINLSPIAVTQPTTFELVCTQAATGTSSVVVVVLYRPGSEAVQQKFFDELADVLAGTSKNKGTSSPMELCSNRGT